MAVYLSETGLVDSLAQACIEAGFGATDGLPSDQSVRLSRKPAPVQAPTKVSRKAAQLPLPYQAVRPLQASSLTSCKERLASFHSFKILILQPST